MKIVSFLFIALSISAQVNTEVFRNKLDSTGFQNKFKTGIHIASGNSDFQTLAFDLYSGYTSDNNRIFLVSKYKRGRQNSSLFINNAFVHIRDTYDINSELDAELFIQNEFNDFIGLKNRWLFGAYLRIDLFPEVAEVTAHLGLGLMSEHEEFPAESSRTITRSTNYLNLTWQINDRITIASNAYYQPDINNFDDSRILSESSIRMPISQIFTFELTINYRYDSEPPFGIKSSDLETLFGLSFEF